MAAPAADKLNVLFLMSDDLRPELSGYGHPTVQTPNIDALGKAGVRFERAYCQYPLCNPSRTSLLTGRYPTTTGVLDNTRHFRDEHPDIVTLPQHFKQNGYVALRTGKIFHGGLDDTAAWTEGGEPRLTARRRKPLARRTTPRTTDRSPTASSSSKPTASPTPTTRLPTRPSPSCSRTRTSPSSWPAASPSPIARRLRPGGSSTSTTSAAYPCRSTSPRSSPCRPVSRAACLTPNGDLFIDREAYEGRSPRHDPRPTGPR